MNKKKLPSFQNIVIAGGGTGGHLFPGISIAEYFHKMHPSCKIRFIGTNRGIEKKVLAKTNFSFFFLPVLGLYRVSFLKKIGSLCLIPIAVLKSLCYLFVWKPDFIIGVGGYASGPFLLACLLLKKTFFIQEQNAYPGMTNRFLGKYANLSFLVYPDKNGFFKHPVVTGNPIRNEIHKLWKNNKTINQNRKNKKFQITILGGSQGSSFINSLVIKSLPFLESIKNKICIVHQTGKLDYPMLQKIYQQSDIDYSLDIFFDKMVEIYKNTHLFICRSGAGVFEMIASGRIGILIPITRSSGEHQKQNALQLQKNAGCFLLEEKDASPEKLVEMVKKIILDKKKHTKLEKISHSYYKGEAAGKIYHSIIKYFENKNEITY